MLSDNIRNFRKKSHMSQDELGEKLGVSRQSISLWETGQTQPTIDNIMALAKIFNISSDMLLGSSDSPDISQEETSENPKPEGKRNIRLIITIAIVTAVLLGVAILVAFFVSSDLRKPDSDNPAANTSVILPENASASSASNETASESVTKNTSKAPHSGNAVNNSDASKVSGNNSKADKPGSPSDAQFDLFTYCKNFAIKKGTLNGDYCIYQQPAAKYGGYDNEYFSISYWSASDMVEFCLHCPLGETYSHNFYLRMRGGYNKKYEYLSSKYFRDTGESLRSATGYIDPAVFSDSYPISCDEYEGSVDGQNEFMEESRVGICDLIHCLKKFVQVENMECRFSDFEFVNF